VTRQGRPGHDRVIVLVERPDGSDGGSGDRPGRSGARAPRLSWRPAGAWYSASYVPAHCRRTWRLARHVSGSVPIPMPSTNRKRHHGEDRHQPRRLTSRLAPRIRRRGQDGNGDRRQTVLGPSSSRPARSVARQCRHDQARRHVTLIHLAMRALTSHTRAFEMHSSRSWTGGFCREMVAAPRNTTTRRSPSAYAHRRAEYAEHAGFPAPGDG
jgi:hypothetical protein